VGALQADCEGCVRGVRQATPTVSSEANHGFRFTQPIQPLKGTMSKDSNFYDSIVREKLSGITFVMDYWQFQFDGPTMNALTRVQVSANGSILRDGDDQFRNLICRQIGKIVSGVALAKSEAFTITFKDSSSISVSLKAEDYVGPEAIVFYGSNQTVVVRDNDVVEFDHKT